MEPQTLLLQQPGNKTMLKSLRKVFLPAAIGWAAVIFFLSQIPGADVPPLIFGMDKLVHAIVFGVLGLLTLGSMRPSANGYRAFQLWLAVALATIYGGLDEAHQHFVPGRTPDIHDIMADAVGAMISVWVFSRVIRPRIQSPE
jgi:VanZ family protein